MPLIVVYVYGPPGCGKSRMLDKIFAPHATCEICGTVYPDRFVSCGRNFMIVDDFCGSEAPKITEYLSKIKGTAEDYFVILCGNEQPDDINIHMDHIFWCGLEHLMLEAREFLQSIVY